MAKEAWGRWGSEDERGALNLVAADEVLRAVSLVKEGRVFRLAQPISEKMMIPPHRPNVMHFMGRDGGDYAAGAKRPGGFQFAEDIVVLPLHLGTHIDALSHAWYDDCLYNGFSGNSIRSTVGAAHCGVEKFTPIVTRGVLLDMVRLHGRMVPNGTAIDRRMIEAACARAGLEIEKGDAVLIRTGWLESQNGIDPDFNQEPGLDLDAAVWLAAAGAALIGTDNFAVEVLPFAKGTVFPVHQRLIRDYGVALMEGLVLAPLGETRVASFLFLAAPLPIVGATASPIAPVAVL
jgi:kynurenine formamidase